MGKDNENYFKNCELVSVVEDSYCAMKEYGFYWGCDTFEITKEQIEQLLNGKLLAMNNGEYSTFIRLRESEE